METQEAQDGKGPRGFGLNMNTSNAVERADTERFFGNLRDDRPFGADAINRQVNVQSKAVFSYAMTLMDKIWVWVDEERWVGSKFAACMWIYTKEALTERTDTRQGTRRISEETHDVYYVLHKLGLCRYVRRLRMGVIKDNYPTRGRNFKHCMQFQNRCSMRGTMEPFVVFSTLECESNPGK